MAKSFKPCSVEGCNKNASGYAGGAYGWCSAHAKRWRKHGDPLAGRTSPGDLLKWLQNHVSFAGDDCLRWPFLSNSHGYGNLKINGKPERAHRLMCFLAHGEATTKAHQAAHSCGNNWCVNPSHLRWADQPENEADKLAHGTHTRGERQNMVKLSEEDVREIRSRFADFPASHQLLAEEFGVSRVQIGRIVRKQSWSWLAD